MKTKSLFVLAAGLLLAAACGETSEPSDTLQGAQVEPTVWNQSEGAPEVEDFEDEEEVEEVENEIAEVEGEMEEVEEENSHDFAAGLEFMREEEKLARDVYITLGDAFGLQVFRNIQESEETHTTAVYDLLDKYDIPDPAYQTDVGEFTNPDLQRIYDELVARGLRGQTEALLVGAYIEEHDILDLDERLDEDDLPDDVRTTYANLRNGSTNHLRAFVGAIEREGVNYSPQLMEVEDYEEALN